VSAHPEHYEGDLNQTPVFLGCSDVDPHIPVKRVHETEDILSSLNANVTKVIYPNMAHTINQDEIDHLNKMICAKI
jgi:Predicted esterase